MPRRKNCISIKIAEKDGLLFKAVKDNVETDIATALRNGADINALNDVGLTCLGEATEAGHLSMVQRLIKVSCILQARVLNVDISQAKR